MLGYWWGVLGVIMVPQSDLPPKPLGATVPQSSLFRWKWAPKLKPLPLHSSKALDSYFWAQSFLGVDKLNHKKKSKISENRLNRLVNYIRLMVLNTKFWFLGYDSEFKKSLENPAEYWAEIGSDVVWTKKWDQVLDNRYRFSCHFDVFLVTKKIREKNR